MPDFSARAEGVTQDGEQSPASLWVGQSNSLLSNGSMQNKTVRFGSLDSVPMAVVKHGIRPGVVVCTLALSILLFGHSPDSTFYATGIVAFLVAAQIFSPLDLRRDSASNISRSLFRLLLEWSCVAAILVFLALSFKLTQAFQKESMLFWIFGTPATLWLSECVTIHFAKHLPLRRPIVERFVIIGANEVGLELARRIEQSESYGKFFGFFDYRHSERLTDVPGNRVRSSCTPGDFANFVSQNGIGRVYIALPMSTAPRIQQLIQELRDTTASIYFVPNLFAYDLVQARCVAINGMPAFSICESPLQGMSAVWKRALDITLSVTALLLLWPLFLAIAILIKRSSPGPVLFKQRRYGLNGEEILIYKFRSMTVCEDGPVIAQAKPQDQRVTRVGAFLRRKSLDEIPQILNVLEGKMSLVGPRPHAVAHNEEYRKLINGYMIRHKVRPGITGWAQVNGLRGETATVDKMHERVQYDLDYLKNWSFTLDLRIIARTAWKILRDRNAY